MASSIQQGRNLKPYYDKLKAVYVELYGAGLDEEEIMDLSDMTMADIKQPQYMMVSLPLYHGSKLGPSNPSPTAREFAPGCDTPDFGFGLYKLPGDRAHVPEPGNSVGSADKFQKQTHGHSHAANIPVPYYGPHCHGKGTSPVVILSLKEPVTIDGGDSPQLPTRPGSRTPDNCWQEDDFETHGQRRRGPRPGSPRTPPDDDHAFIGMQLGGHHHFRRGSCA